MSKPLAYWDRLLGGVVVIAANAGGAWTPIGDVTTTMLWIHGHVTTLKIIQVSLTQLFLCYKMVYLYISFFGDHYFINFTFHFPKFLMIDEPIY